MELSLTFSTIAFRIAKSDASSFTQTIDWSFNPDAEFDGSPLPDWHRITVHRGGVLVAGSEPPP